jgi:pimeloyl-ACP methyl ester carboxylesterase
MNVHVTEGGIDLPGLLSLPPHPKGLVIFAHGTSSSRLSPRNRQVAEELTRAGLGSLLFDLLTEEEAFDRSNVFDISLLARRVLLATRWVRAQEFGKTIPIGYFGASTGAAAALWAATEPGNRISAVVSRGGRPDLVIERLNRVTAPTLLIVGGADSPVLKMNEEALDYIPRGQLVIIPGATHLFEEPGTLESVAKEAVRWFLSHFSWKAAA